MKSVYTSRTLEVTKERRKFIVEFYRKFLTSKIFIEVSVQEKIQRRFLVLNLFDIGNSWIQHSIIFISMEELMRLCIVLLNIPQMGRILFREEILDNACSHGRLKMIFNARICVT